MTRPSEFSPTKQRVFDFIVEFKQKHDGNSPSIREIAAALNDGDGDASSSVVNYYLNCLQDLKLIKVRSTKKGAARMIKVIGAKWIAPAFKLN